MACERAIFCIKWSWKVSRDDSGPGKGLSSASEGLGKGLSSNGLAMTWQTWGVILACWFLFFCVMGASDCMGELKRVLHFGTLNLMMPGCTDVGYERRFWGLVMSLKMVKVLVLSVVLSFAGLLLWNIQGGALMCCHGGTKCGWYALGYGAWGYPSTWSGWGKGLWYSHQLQDLLLQRRVCSLVWWLDVIWCGKMFFHLGFYQYKVSYLLLFGSGGWIF